MVFKKELSDDDINKLLNISSNPFVKKNNHLKPNKVMNNYENKSEFITLVEIPHFNQDRNKFKILRIEEMHTYDKKSNEEKKIILLTLEEGEKGVSGKTRIVFSLNMELTKLYLKL